MTTPSDPTEPDDSLEITAIPSLEDEMAVPSFELFQPADVPARQERTRAALALLFAILFVIIALTPILFIWANGIAGWQAIKEWYLGTLPAITAVVGSAMGFYFGTRSNSA